MLFVFMYPIHHLTNKHNKLTYFLVVSLCHCPTPFFFTSCDTLRKPKLITANKENSFTLSKTKTILLLYFYDIFYSYDHSIFFSRELTEQCTAGLFPHPTTLTHSLQKSQHIFTSLISFNHIRIPLFSASSLYLPQYIFTN